MYIANETNSMEVTVDMQMAKALELLGKYLGLFEGNPQEEAQNNLLEAILAATREEVDTHDLPELQ